MTALSMAGTEQNSLLQCWTSMVLTWSGTNCEEARKSQDDNISGKRSTSANLKLSSLAKVSSKSDIKLPLITIHFIHHVMAKNLAMIPLIIMKLWERALVVATLAACVMGDNKRAWPTAPLIGFNWERIGRRYLLACLAGSCDVNYETLRLPVNTAGGVRLRRVGCVVISSHVKNCWPAQYLNTTSTAVELLASKLSKVITRILGVFSSSENEIWVLLSYFWHLIPIANLFVKFV